MVVAQYRRAVGTFLNCQDAEHAIDELNSAGFPRDQIYVVAKDAEVDAQLDRALRSEDFWYKAQEGTATCWSITGSMLGALGGCLVGLGILTVPGVAAFVAVGTSAGTLAATLAGAGIGVASGGLISANRGLGMTSDTARIYSDRFSGVEYLVMVDGTDDEVRRAESIVSRSYYVDILPRYVEDDYSPIALR